MTCPKGCHIPEEEHRCFAIGLPGHRCSGALTHQHRPKKGMGGHNSASKIVALLCWPIHDRLDNAPGRPWRDTVEVIELGGLIGRFYRIYRDDSDEGTRIEITNWTNEEVLA